MSKTVSIVAHSFDCLPGHVQISSRGFGSNLRVAICCAVRKLWLSPELRHKQVHNFKLTVVVEANHGES